MVHPAQTNELSLVATSAADDAGFVALADVATILNRPEFAHAVVIGGHMVTLHARRRGLNLYRETQDADLGIPQLSLNTTDVGPALEALGYRRARRNRFAKRLVDDSPGPAADSEDVEAIIDILVPALTSHPRKDVEVGDVVTIEVPGLAEALNRPPVVVVLRLARRNGAIQTASVKIPDERSALILKAMAWDARRAGKDAVDVWRCLEIALAAGLGPDDLASGDGRRAMVILDTAFSSETSDGVVALAKTQGLNEEALTTRATRIRALVARLGA